MSRPFVIAIASEKGWVGKTTVATNLAVYLKALREDLPVTIASFDNHFSVDQMFALGARPEQTVAAFFAGTGLEQLLCMGQFGVQYIASSRRLSAPSQDPDWLRQQLAVSRLPGILILDTRPILDWFSEAALLAADLVIVPIKDRAALINADALRQILAATDRSERLWLLPSMVDARARLNAEVRVYEFLVYAARERNYQVLDLFISKSPKVESLASGFSSRLRPVLTHARKTAVHNQFKQLAEFALDRFDDGPGDRPGPRMCTAGRPPGPSRRTVRECPVCCRRADRTHGHMFFAFGSRRQGFVHPDCFQKVLAELGTQRPADEGGVMALVVDGPGLIGPDCRIAAHCFDAEAELFESTDVPADNVSLLTGSLSAMIGQPLQQAYRELVLLGLDVTASTWQAGTAEVRSFKQKRREIVRELRQAGLY